jgi:hypothetical protein
MFCFKCGRALPDEAAFCFACGTKLPHAEEQRTYASAAGTVASTVQQQVGVSPPLEQRRAPESSSLVEAQQDRADTAPTAPEPLNEWTWQPSATDRVCVLCNQIFQRHAPLSIHPVGTSYTSRRTMEAR